MKLSSVLPETRVSSLIDADRRGWKIITSELCELCNEGPEDVLHALWNCRVLEGVWSCHSWSQQALNPPPLTFCDLVDCFLQVTEDFRKEIFAVSAWWIWNRRNALHFGRQVQPIANINSLASNFLQEFLAAQEEEAQPVHLPIIHHQWRPPKQGYFKINFDAAVFKPLNLAGIGVVIRDWRWSYCCCVYANSSSLDSCWLGSACLSPCRDVCCWKGSSKRYLRRGLSFSDQRYLSGESGVELVWRRGGRHSHLSFCFQSFHFVHVHRSCNVVADALAKKAKCSVGPQEWVGRPSCWYCPTSWFWL